MRIRGRYVLGLIALAALGMLTGCEEGDFYTCDTNEFGRYCCTVSVKGIGFPGYYARAYCSGEGIEGQHGCPVVAMVLDCRDATGPLDCIQSTWCVEETGGSIWLADVCEPDDGFSGDGWMTWDSDYAGPLQVGASMDGPWHEVQVNGPPWAVSEVNLESFAELAGVEDWHDLWVRSGEGYPQHVGNAVLERDGRMDALCAE